MTVNEMQFLDGLSSPSMADTGSGKGRAACLTQSQPPLLETREPCSMVSGLSHCNTEEMKGKRTSTHAPMLKVPSAVG